MITDNIFSPDDGEGRIVSTHYKGEDGDVELSLRPRALRDYIGQDAAKENLKVFIDAARGRGESLDHVLLHGPPGLGKTTLAGIIAAEMGASFRVTSGPAIERQGDLAAILTGMEDGDVLFIDEIHGLSRAVQEVLYSAMEDYRIDIIIGKGPSARSIPLDLPRFTLVGATTRAGQLSSPLRDRFGIIFRLEMYTTEQLLTIVKRSAGILGVTVEPDGAVEIASRSRGTPRVANRILKRVRDYAQVRGDGVVTKAMAQRALDMLEIDALGLDRTDRALLSTLIRAFDGGPAGLETLSATLGEEVVTLEDVCEPFLMQLGFLKRTPRGRCATRLAYGHLGVTFPERDGGDGQLGME